MRYAIIGAGMAGLSAGNILKEQGHEIKIFEQKSVPGGLISCDRVDGNLYHKVGGHVFNSKHKDVLEWFFGKFDKTQEFLEAKREAKILFNDKYIGYPIENYLYQLPHNLLDRIIDDIIKLIQEEQENNIKSENFGQFLKKKFGSTLFDIYFEPYNKKIWQCNLNNVAVEWLEGKLPMPNYKEMLIKSIRREEEENMVHSKFFYPKNDGSQFIADRLAQNMNIEYNKKIIRLDYENGKWHVNNSSEKFDFIIYTGDIRALKKKLPNWFYNKFTEFNLLENLQSHGTSNALCEINKPNNFSWIYLPDENVKPHRIINTGNFSTTNNSEKNKRTCIVEFSGKLSSDEMRSEIKKLPGELKPIAFHHEENTYVIQDKNTRKNVKELKEKLKIHGFYLHGRFAEWEYYNMDTIIKASLDNFSL